jgi:hypothetical protein
VRQGGAVVLAPEHAEQSAHLDEGLPAAVLDVLQGFLVVGA